MQNDDYDVDEGMYENSASLTNTEEEKLTTRFKEYLADKLKIAINARHSGYKLVEVVLATKENEKHKNNLIIKNLRKGGYGDGTYPLHEQISPKDGSYPYQNDTGIYFKPSEIKNTDETVKIILDEIIKKGYSVENFTPDELKIIQNEMSKTNQIKENNDESNDRNNDKNNDENLISSNNPFDDNNDEKTKPQKQNESETLDDSVFVGPINKEAFAFNQTKSDDANNQDNNDEEKPEEKLETSQPNSFQNNKSKRDGEFSQVSSEYFKQRDLKKYELVTKGRMPFSNNVLNLTSCLNNNLAAMNMGNSTQYGINQAEACFEKDIQASKQAVKNMEDKLKQFENFPGSFLFPIAFLIYLIRKSYEDQKQIRYKIINYKEAKELEKFIHMTKDEIEAYMKNHMLLDKANHTTIIHDNIDDFKNEFENDIKDSLDSAAKFSTNGKYDDAKSMLEDGYLDEKLSEDEIGAMAKNNLASKEPNEYKKELFDKKEVVTNADKISLETCDNLQKIYSLNKSKIDDNVAFLESECQKNLQKLANDEEISKSNQIIINKVMSNIEIGNEKTKKSVEDLVTLKIDDFHRHFRNTGDLDFDRLEKSIDEAAKKIDPNLNGLGKFVLEAIDHERLTQNATTDYFLKDIPAIAKIHDTLGKIDFINKNIKICTN